MAARLQAPPTWEGPNRRARRYVSATASRMGDGLRDWLGPLGTERLMLAHLLGVEHGGRPGATVTDEDLQRCLILQREIREYYPATYAWQTDAERGEFRMPTIEELNTWMTERNNARAEQRAQ